MIDKNTQSTLPSRSTPLSSLGFALMVALGRLGMHHTNFLTLAACIEWICLSCFPVVLSMFRNAPSDRGQYFAGLYGDGSPRKRSRSFVMQMRDISSSVPIPHRQHKKAKSCLRRQKAMYTGALRKRKASR